MCDLCEIKQPQQVFEQVYWGKKTYLLGCIENQIIPKKQNRNHNYEIKVKKPKEDPDFLEIFPELRNHLNLGKLNLMNSKIKQ